MPFSTSYANDILNYTFAKTASLSAPSSVYIGLCTNDPEADGGAFMELSDNAYARVLISQRGSNYPALIGNASSRAISNIAQINWNKANPNAWARSKGFGLFSSASGGSPFFYGKLELTEEEEAAGGILCEAGAVMLFDPNTLRISFPTTDVDEATTTVNEQ